LYTVDLSKSLDQQASTKVTVHAAFIHSMTPFPAAISQSERQYVRYYDNHYFITPYTTQTQTTNVKVPTTTIESKSELNPTTVKGDTITYGPYENTKPFSSSPMNVHFENNKPFITVTYLVREIEISHWGNVAVEENYLLQHDGAKLKGTFSRYDYQRNPRGAPSHVPQLTEVLPAVAADVYYRDDIGNISTSHLSLREKGQTLELTPRFPLFGGWKIGFYLGYNLPAQQFLFSDYNDGGRYMLNTSFAPLFTEDSIVIDQMIVRIILPEGARDFEVVTPFTVDKRSADQHYTYLDTSGRPVIVLEKRNVLASEGVLSHHQDFQVLYRFRTLSMLQEPFLLMTAYFGFFLFVMLYVRVQFKIAPVKERSPQQDRIDDLIARFRDIVDARTDLHESLDRALANVLSSKNVNQYLLDRKTAENNFASLRKEVGNILKELEELPSKAGEEAARRLREIERREERREKAQGSLQNNEVDYKVKKTTPKKAYDDTKNEMERALQAAEDEVESALQELSL
jgi:oligosaccharyltransferase complex subunit alpha (ribophorin I)